MLHFVAHGSARFPTRRVHSRVPGFQSSCCVCNQLHCCLPRCDGELISDESEDLSDQACERRIDLHDFQVRECSNLSIQIYC
jgi:hypothetical protein